MNHPFPTVTILAKRYVQSLDFHEKFAQIAGSTQKTAFKKSAKLLRDDYFKEAIHIANTLSASYPDFIIKPTGDDA